MKQILSFIPCALTLAAFSAAAQTSNTLAMPLVGQPLPAAKFELISQIAKSCTNDWPKALSVFRYSAKPSVFRIESLQKLLNESIFSGTNLLDFLTDHTNASQLGMEVKFGTAKGLDSFFANPFRGGILLQAHGTGVDVRKEVPPTDGVPSFDAIRTRVIQYAQAFGVSTNEMEKKADGSIALRRTDGKTVMQGGAINYISRRSVGVSRNVAGYVFLGNDDKIDLVLGVNGWLEHFEMNWPRMEAVRTNRIFTVERLLKEIKSGNALGDMSNEYPSDGVAQIILKEVRIDYYACAARGFGSVSTNTDIIPIAELLAVFKSKSGETTEGELFAPLLESK
jgi:hypothetical protein